MTSDIGMLSTHLVIDDLLTVKQSWLLNYLSFDLDGSAVVNINDESIFFDWDVKNFEEIASCITDDELHWHG